MSDRPNEEGGWTSNHTVVAGGVLGGQDGCASETSSIGAVVGLPRAVRPKKRDGEGSTSIVIA